MLSRASGGWAARDSPAGVAFAADIDPEAYFASRLDYCEAINRPSVTLGFDQRDQSTMQG